jgi:hypothetical protein
MTKKFKVLDYDIIYLSYDEPNAEKNYSDLVSKVPWAKRVHGVKGSDAAHKACAELSETDRFITVDGDNVVDSSFLRQEIDFKDNADLENSVISWAAKNQINGLMYGNGGIKCWPKQHVLDMRTHEAADPRNIQAQVEFCWDTRYIQMEGCFSKIMNNGSPKQAWRAGFREGVKMALDQGEKPKTVKEFLNLHWKNLHRLWIWMTVGADVENGMWAIYGAREGLYKTMCTDWDYINVRDFDWLNNYWNTEIEMFNGKDLTERTEQFGKLLINELKVPISATPLDYEQSKFFKTVYQNPARMTNKLLEREK